MVKVMTKTHRFTAIFMIVLLALGLLAGCSSSESDNSDDTSPASTEEKTVSVYWLNFNPKADAGLQEIARVYEETTGVPVKITTVSSNEYDTTLETEMAKGDKAPTIFNLGTETRVVHWGDSCLDLRETDVYQELAVSDYNVYDDANHVLAIPYCIETFGLVVDLPLLKQAGYTLEDLYNFDSMKAVADDIHARTEELGFDAFTSSELNTSAAARITQNLVNIPLYYEARDEDWLHTSPPSIKGTYLDNFKQTWDLYTTDCAYDRAKLSISDLDSSAQFQNREAVFTLAGSWEYAELSEIFADDEMAMIPIYIGVEGEENAGLCTGTGSRWAVNANASREDQLASLDFMYWLVSSREGLRLMEAQFGRIPYNNAEGNENIFYQNAAQYEEDGKYNVEWAYLNVPEGDQWRGGLMSALNHYDIGDGWEYVKIAFVDDWPLYYEEMYE